MAVTRTFVSLNLCSPEELQIATQALIVLGAPFSVMTSQGRAYWTLTYPMVYEHDVDESLDRLKGIYS